MFTYEDVAAKFGKQPFEPVQIVLSTGQTYDVRHPDMVWLTRRFMMVGTPIPGYPNVADSSTQVAYLHIAEFRSLPTPVPTGSNGQS